MTRYSIFLSGVAVVGLLAFGTFQARADADVDGMDHSKLNHGVLGRSAQPPAPAAAIAPPAPVAQQQASLDPNVTGTDHSKLNHGVLGVASAASPTSPAASAPTKWLAPK